MGAETTPARPSQAGRRLGNTIIYGLELVSPTFTANWLRRVRGSSIRARFTQEPADFLEAIGGYMMIDQPGTVGKAIGAGAYGAGKTIEFTEVIIRKIGQKLPKRRTRK